MDISTQHKSNIWKFYIASILGGFTYFYNGIETLYYRHFNLSFEQIGFLISSMLLATILLEIPTGAFADLYGRKKSLILSAFAGLIGITLLAFGSSFDIFAAGFIFLGASRAFSSGAGSALLYDSLHSLQKADDFIKHKSRINSAFIAIDLISGTLGFWIFAFNVRLPYYISLIAWILVFIVQFSMYESFLPTQRTTNFLTHNLNQMKKGILLTIKSFPIVWITLFSFLFFVSCRFFSDVVSTPYFQETKQFSLFQLGILFFITNLIQTVFVLFSPKLVQKFGFNKSYILTLLIVPLTYFVMILSNSYLITGIIVGIYYAIISFSEIVTETHLNNLVTSDHRATVLSVSSMFISLLSLIIIPQLGAKTDQSDLSSGMQLLATLTLLGAVLVGLLQFLTIKTESTKKD